MHKFLRDKPFSSGKLKGKMLLRVAIIGAIVGVFLLYIISQGIEVNENSIGKIEDEEMGNDVKLMGVVTGIYSGEDASIITVSQPSEMKVLVTGQVNLSEGDYIEVIGEVDEYNGEREIIGNRVRIIS
jgi:hypothetical protein